MKRQKPLRLITKETIALSRSEQPRQSKTHRRGGLVIKSAEGVRFAYASATLPGEVGRVTLTKVEYPEMPDQESDQESLPPELPEMLE